MIYYSHLYNSLLFYYCMFEFITDFTNYIPVDYLAEKAVDYAVDVAFGATGAAIYGIFKIN